MDWRLRHGAPAVETTRACRPRTPPLPLRGGRHTRYTCTRAQSPGHDGALAAFKRLWYSKEMKRNAFLSPKGFTIYTTFRSFLKIPVLPLLLPVSPGVYLSVSGLRLCGRHVSLDFLVFSFRRPVPRGSCHTTRAPGVTVIPSLASLSAPGDAAAQGGLPGPRRAGARWPPASFPHSCLEQLDSGVSAVVPSVHGA